MRARGALHRRLVSLSGVLNRMRPLLGRLESEGYRNPNGVYMKMMNFRRFDPAFTADGGKGLTKGNKLEAVVWAEFAGDPAKLSSIARAVRNAIDEGLVPGEQDVDLEGGLDEAPEGRILTHVHRRRERDRRLVAEAKRRALRRNGRL